MRKIIIYQILVLAITLPAKSQTFEKTFQGNWGDTFWEFNFHIDSTFKRTSAGHYGFTEVIGKYRVYNDTLQIIEGFKNTHGTISEYYLLEKGEYIIDLKNLYDYKIKRKEDDPNYMSRKRKIIINRSS